MRILVMMVSMIMVVVTVMVMFMMAAFPGFQNSQAGAGFDHFRFRIHFGHKYRKFP